MLGNLRAPFSDDRIHRTGQGTTTVRFLTLRELLQPGGAAFSKAFAHELRRFYPFAPFIGARALKDLTWANGSRPARWCC
jgi:hypothetical protein